MTHSATILSLIAGVSITHGADYYVSRSGTPHHARYVRRGRTLVVVSNLTRQSVSGKLLLDQEMLDLPGCPLRAEELRSGKVSALKDEALALDIGAADLAILVIN